MELLESIKYTSINFHLNSVLCIDISDKYLVSGSADCSCVIWRIPDFKPIKHLIVLTERGTSGLIN